MTHPHEALAEGAIYAVAYLLWQIDQGYISAEDRAVGENWMLGPVENMHADDATALPGWLDAASEVLRLTADHFAEAVTEARAEGWDEGYDARGVDISNEGLTEVLLTPNPHRRARADSLAPEAPAPGTLAYAEMVAGQHGDLEDAAVEDGMDPAPEAPSEDCAAICGPIGHVAGCSALPAPSEVQR